jgi:DNA-binding CsgD family transcriptional regulator
LCEALGDFADLKSARRGNHSHTVARLTAQAAAHLGLPIAEQERLRRAALVHDLGKIAVPYRLLQESGDDTRAASHRGGSVAEPIRLHPYYAQRILSRVRPLADLAADVSAHHERVDGSGYPLGLAAPNISIGARLLAAADAWAERAGNGSADRAGDDGLDPACMAALRSSTGRGTGRQRQRSDAGLAGPAGPGLSSRELEVLRLLADGASNVDISKTLYISRRTAEHHVEHILAKLTVTSRTAAVAYALTHELLA